MRLFRCLGLYWITALLLTACSPAAQAPKLVFAHFMLANQNDVPDDADSELVISSYARQIRQAQAIGIDGFALNVGGWFKEPRYIRRSAEMFEAAYRLHSGFRLFFSIDMCCSNDAEDAEDMIRRFANNSRYADLYFKQNGKVVVTTFAGSKYGFSFWQQFRHDLEQGSHPSTREVPGAIAAARGVPSSKPLPIFLVPAFFWGGELPRASDIETGLEDYASIIDGAFYWGIAGVPGLGHAPDQIPSSDAYGSVLHHAGKLYMAPICFQFWGANAGRDYEYSGFSGMRDMWMHAIHVSHPEWVEIITWNDFIEGTYVSPIDDPAKYPQANDLAASAAPPATLHYFHSHRGATELLAYFIDWYKTGVQPPLDHDSIFWAYRTQLLGQSQQAIKLYGPVADVVYVTANLTAPAVLHVSFGDVSRTVSLPAGSNDVQVAIPSGNDQPPVFALTRAAVDLAQGRGEDPISAKAPYPNLYYSTGSMRD